MLHMFNTNDPIEPIDQATRQIRAEEEAMKKLDEWMIGRFPEMERAAILTAFDINFYDDRIEVKHKINTTT